FMLPTSPIWKPSWPHLPCGCVVGFQCPPAFLPSGSEQSGFSCTCTACSPSGTPSTVTLSFTFLPSCVSVNLPVSLLPLLASMGPVTSVLPLAIATPPPSATARPITISLFMDMGLLLILCRESCTYDE